MPLPRDGDELYETVIEPLMTPLNARRVDWRKLRARLPPSHGRDKRIAGRVALDDVLVHPGSLVIGNGVELASSAMLVVLGDLTITGGVYSPPIEYSLILAGGALAVDRLHTSGDVIAMGGIRADLWWGSYNDYSTYAPTLRATTYIASDDRSDIIGKLTARTKLVGFDLAAKLRKRFPTLDPSDEDSLRAFLGLVKAASKRGKSTPGDRDQLRAALDAALKVKDRTAKVKAIRAVYATIKKRKLADLGDLLVDMIERKTKPGSDWSLQDELELLAYLKRADLLESLSSKKLRGYEKWIPALLEKARA